MITSQKLAAQHGAHRGPIPSREICREITLEAEHFLPEPMPPATLIGCRPLFGLFKFMPTIEIARPSVGLKVAPASKAKPAMMCSPDKPLEAALLPSGP